MEQTAAAAGTGMVAAVVAAVVAVRNEEDPDLGTGWEAVALGHGWDRLAWFLHQGTVSSLALGSAGEFWFDHRRNHQAHTGSWAGAAG